MFKLLGNTAKLKRFSKSGSSIKDKPPVDPHKRIKQGIWLYFLLLIFEGALRKWVLPGFSAPLLIVRDPVALWLLFICLQKGILKFNFYLTAMWLVAFIAFTTAVTFGHGNFYVATFGLRIFILHFPLIFVIGRIFDERDVVKLGKVLMWIVIPMTLLMVLQFYSPQSAWVNRGLAGNIDGAGYWGAQGYFRPPGTFSFTTGLGQFYGLAAAFIFYFWLVDFKFFKQWFLLIVTGCLLMSIPFSISRTLFFSIGISFLFAVIASTRTPRYLSRFIIAFAGGVILLTILNNFVFFQTGVEIFTDRFESANLGEGGVEGVFFDRFLGDMIGAINNSSHIPFWGIGLGAGTNAGAMMMTGNVTFLVAEGEWGRIIGEMGLFLGLAVIGIRAAFTLKLVLRSIPAMINKNFLPWMLLSFGFLIILQGQWAQPTALGFATLTGGLILAAFKNRIRLRQFKTT